jgi:hypothetical protein
MLLYPPQVYELQRLAQHRDIDQLNKFFINRQSKGVSTWLPRFARVGNEVIGYLPGKLSNLEKSNLGSFFCEKYICMES